MMVKELKLRKVMPEEVNRRGEVLWIGEGVTKSKKKKREREGD